MSEEMIQIIADNADMIIAGFSYTLQENGTVRVLNLENTDQACVLTFDGTMLETSMDDITLATVQAYYLKNKEFMEVDHA